MKTDSLFYRIFQTSPAAFFDLIGSPNPNAADYRFTSEEVKQTSFRIDGILTPPPDSPHLPLYFIEVMGYRDRNGDLYPGLFSEIFLYLNSYRPANNWRAVLIFTQRRLDPGLPNHYQDFDNGIRLQRIYLNELPAEVANQSLELGILYLVGVRAEVAPDQARQLIVRAQQELSDGSNRRQIIELIQTVLVYKFPNLSTQDIQAMLGLSELKQTKVYQEALQEGEAVIVLRLLTRRLGNLEPELQTQIQQLDPSQLEQLADALLDFSTLNDLLSWLESNPSAS